MDRIRVLQYGQEDWSKLYWIPEYVDWEYHTEIVNGEEREYDITFIDRVPRILEIRKLYKMIHAHTLFVTDAVTEHPRLQDLILRKKGRVIEQAGIQEFLRQELRYFGRNSSGEKYGINQIAISHMFSGEVFWNGGYSVDLSGDFGEDFKQIIIWRNNIELPAGEEIELWLEYQKTDLVELSLKIDVLVPGYVGGASPEFVYSEKDMQEPIHLLGGDEDSILFISILAKGKGTLRLISLHNRKSKGSYGFFLPGGERHVASDREEVFSFFDPGDLKPPLNIYFSDYKTAQGFEGYSRMKSLGSPFLLLTESRLEGGGFYMGTPEYERMISDIIDKYKRELQFTDKDIIFSGMSMGAYGALYYGCGWKPHAFILGKPLVNIGNIAANTTFHRPGRFSTSMDVLLYHCGDTSAEAVGALNRSFWDKFDRANFSESKFIISYMLEDDYDQGAYEQILLHLKDHGVEVYGKGIHGRHEEKDGEVVQWFMRHYKKIMKEDFARNVEE